MQRTAWLQKDKYVPLPFQGGSLSKLIVVRDALETKLADANAKISVNDWSMSGMYRLTDTARSFCWSMFFPLARSASFTHPNDSAMERGAASSMSGHGHEASSSIDHGSFTAELDQWDHARAQHRISNGTSDAGSKLR